ncbi:MAG: hypothetical protein SV062_07465 [Thermodesulfobacteriota bacterium]|nr:hypothetical protein [Thermodesulfobacteriota bacterium]
MKKQLVYIVTCGVYSDYHICGVFTNKALAQKYINCFNGGNGYSEMKIEEWCLDPWNMELRKGYHAWFVRMAKGGDTIEIEKADSDYGYCSGATEYGFDIYYNMYAHVMAKNEEHAIKITNELRVMAIANDDWPDN